MTSFDFSGSLNDIADSALAAMRELAPADAEAYAAQWIDALITKRIKTGDRVWSSAEVEEKALYYLVGRQGANNAFTDDVLGKQREKIIHWGDKSFRLTDRQRAAIIRIVVSDLGSGVVPAASHYAAAEMPALRGADPVVDAAQERAQSAMQNGIMEGVMIIQGNVNQAAFLLSPPYNGIQRKQDNKPYPEIVVNVDGWAESAVDAVVDQIETMRGCWIAPTSIFFNPAVFTADED